MPGGAAPRRAGVFDAEGRGVGFQGPAHLVDGRLQVPCLLSDLLSQVADVPAGQGLGDVDAEDGGGTRPRRGVLLFGRFGLVPKGPAAPDRLQPGELLGPASVEHPVAVGEERVDGDDEAGDGFVEAGPAVLGDPLADLLDGVVTARRGRCGGELVDPPPPFEGHVQRPVVDLSEFQGCTIRLSRPSLSRSTTVRPERSSIALVIQARTVLSSPTVTALRVCVRSKSGCLG